MHPIHHFSSSGAAYDACQCDEGIKDGDILVIESEGVVGIADAWPIAVTKVHGELHTLADGVSPEDLEKPALVAGYRAAVEFAKSLGLEVS